MLITLDVTNLNLIFDTSDFTWTLASLLRNDSISSISSNKKSVEPKSANLHSVDNGYPINQPGKVHLSLQNSKIIPQIITFI